MIGPRSCWNSERAEGMRMIDETQVCEVFLALYHDRRARPVARRGAPVNPTQSPRDKFHTEREARERASCPACIEKRLHTEQEWKNHPYRGHGISDGKPSREDLAPSWNPGAGRRA